MELSDVTQLVKLLDKSGLTELRFNDGTASIVLKKESHSAAAPTVVHAPVAAAAPAPVAAAPSAPAEVSSPAEKSAASKYKEITSPMVGTFYACPSPGAEAFVKAGSVIKPGQVLCVIEAMKIMNEIESDLSGEIVETCVANETPVEYGTVLFRVRPA
jgi:acetyl-CoA carboxylase biotin carboxyl carrier protein